MTLQELEQAWRLETERQERETLALLEGLSSGASSFESVARSLGLSPLQARARLSQEQREQARRLLRESLRNAQECP